MRWWVSSLDLASTAKYNLAARWLLRQTGIVRQRGEEFNPEDLAYKPAEMGIDPTTNDEIEITPPDYLRGLNKLLDALESINGQTVLDKRGELRSQFYLELQRKPGERLSEFCTRFRTLVADLQAEQVHLPASELGWFLKNKIGLDPLRRQLLETALQGREEYNVIEAEVLRLFKDLHLADPLHRKFGQGGDKPRLSIRRMFQSVGPSSSASSSASTISRSPSMFSSASSFRRPSTASVSSAPTRKVYMAEVPEEGHEDGPVEEVLEASAETAEDVEEPGLVDFLQSEAECLATELQAAEEQGADPDLLQSVEADFEQAAEALVTMKEARSKLQELRKDRGFGKPSPGGPAGGAKNAGVPAARKASGRHPCFDCNQHGHWAGDKECPKPGAGLGRKPLAVAKAKPRQVRVTEALHAEHDPSTVLVGTSSSSPPSASLPVDPKVHEASMVNHVGSLRLDQALDFTINNHRVSHAALIAGSPPASQVLSEEKILVGALDSACNRTCCGEFWLDTYVEHLKSSAPAWITNLIVNVDETERFKFGNGGTVPSTKRWRIPICLGQKRLLLLWISVVPISSLGCLLGRDFMDARGAVLDFGNRTVEFRFIQLQRLDLAQMSAGHFMLPLQPNVLELLDYQISGMATPADTPYELIPLTPSLIAQYTEHVGSRAFVPYRWRRFILRMLDRAFWHARSLLLWLAPRSHLRYLPFPYPAISSVTDWKLQAQTMVDNHSMSRRHHYYATNRNLYTDMILQTFLLTRQMKGHGQRVKQAALDEARERARQETAVQDREILARQMIGPRGGLPPLRADLVRLALLLNVEVDAKDTIANLQKKIRPIVDILKQKPTPASSSTLKHQTVPSTPPGRSGVSTWSSPPSTAWAQVDRMTPPLTPEQRADMGSNIGQELHAMELKVQALMKAQDERFNAMMQTVLQAVQNQQSGASVDAKIEIVDSD
ncbi:unnamed protein product [Durusdinium trenchii]|uniref:Uncharacterized protein n=1 Tax=Durusdinium trenchii TaxID=1381693 RepID=A0ABP0S9Z2_9DINO